MSKLDHTLAATYTNLGDNKYVSKTITGCVAGQPIIIGCKTTYNADFTIGFKVTAGSNIGMTNGIYYRLGTYWSISGIAESAQQVASVPSCVIVPTATSVTISFFDLDDSETVYIYKT